MIHCDNDKCEYCRRDHHGELVCSADPYFMATHDSLMGHIVVCGLYRERSGPQVPDLFPGRNRDGLFPGQIGYKK